MKLKSFKVKNYKVFKEFFSVNFILLSLKS